jgi:uncharacterized protein (TIGR02996 family)
MNERDALMRAICENPDDDTPRLVFADWLQEHGEDDRAEFIRAQVRFGELLRHGAPDTAGLARRARELWIQHGTHWRSELPQVADIAWHDAFFRGFPERAVVTTDAVLVAHTAIFDHVPIRHLKISAFAAVNGFESLPCLQRLKTLSLSATDSDGSIFRRLVDKVRLNKSTLLILYGGLSGNDKYHALRAAFGDQVSGSVPPPVLPPPPPPPAPSRRKRRK